MGGEGNGHWKVKPASRHQKPPFSGGKHRLPCRLRRVESNFAEGGYGQMGRVAAQEMGKNRLGQTKMQNPDAGC